MNLAILDSLQRRYGTADWSKYQAIRGTKYDTVRVRVTGTNQLQFFSNPIGAGDPGSFVTPFSKTLEQTNLVKSASFGQEYFALTQIRTHVNFAPLARQTVSTFGTNFVYRGYTARDNSAMEKLWDLMHSGILNISFGQKLYYQIQQPFLNAPAGFGLNIASLASSRTGTGDPGATPTPTGENDPQGQNWLALVSDRFDSVYNVDPVQIIEPEVQISATIDFPDNNTPDFTNSALTTADLTFSPIVEAMLVFDGYIIRPSQ
jgi:hypothetical protein